MDISYKIENDLDWNNAEFIDINPEGWKTLRIKFIDAYPFVFWRINEIPRNFRSNSDLVSRKGVDRFFSENLEALKTVITHELDAMPDERKKFYKDNIIGLFDE
jgi:hypothetical protein